MSKSQTKPEPKATADNIPVYCAHDAIVKTADMKPNPKNPNQHPEEQLRRLGSIIRAAGWRNPITVSTRSGLIVRGHGRLMAAQLAGLNEVPVDYQNYATEADELADLVADNRIAELSDPDMQKLAEVFASIEESDTSIDLTGYSREEYDELSAARGNGNGETVPTITGDHNDRITDYTAVVCYDLTRRDVAREYGDQSPTLLGFRGSGGGNTPVVASRPTYCLQGNGIDRSETAGCNGKGIKEGVCYTLNTIDRPAVSDGAEGYIVRRLTPLECERLQGFPDGWTDIGEWIDEKGKTRQTTDAVRYKALGNSIAIPPWKWVLKRLCAYYERDATMASLFDGIGGFPLIWEQLNGCGSCLWASEIEEFPLAVTKKHFQGVTA